MPRRRKYKSHVSHFIYSIGIILIIVLSTFLLTSCGDLVDQPDQPKKEEPKSPEPPKEDPKKPEEPKKPDPPPSEDTQGEWEKCEAERQWAYGAHLIDVNQLRLYQKRNFAPVFNTPGERQSGIDGWVPCKKALEINGFIPPPDSSYEPPVIQTPPVLTPKAPPVIVEPPPVQDDETRIASMCEEERKWALQSGLIDINQYRLFQKRNFAPVFNTPGERQSGIDGWVDCRKALEINHFISN